MKQIVQRAASDWLHLRRPADEVARQASLVAVAGLDRHLVKQRAGGAVVNIIDVGAGTGANMAWLAPRLGVPQRWTLVDRDEDLLDEASGTAAPTNVVGMRRVAADLEDLDGVLATENADLVTCTALLDVLTSHQVISFCELLASKRCAVLFSLSVTGWVRLSPEDVLDSEVERIFNEHQRRGGLAGPEATSLAADVLTSCGLDVTVVDTPWKLGPGNVPLMRRYITDRAASVVEHNPDRGSAVHTWLDTRLAQLERGRLLVHVGHQDVIGVPHPPAP